MQDYEVIDGIVVFHNDIVADHADYNSAGLDSLYDAEERHFWFLARKAFIASQMKHAIKPSSKIIEIGAGTGNVSRFLRRKGYSNISVGEMHLNGLRYAKSYGINECYQFDLLRAPFEDEFDCVCMFDVLEHISDDGKALANINQILKDGGEVVITVPAHQWLWCYEDVIAGHKKRYTRAELVTLLQKTGFNIITARYFFISIVPLLWLRKFLHSWRRTVSKGDTLAGDISMNPFVNWILLRVSSFENKLNRFLPNYSGGSLFVIAKKTSSHNRAADTTN